MERPRRVRTGGRQRQRFLVALHMKDFTRMLCVLADRRACDDLLLAVTNLSCPPALAACWPLKFPHKAAARAGWDVYDARMEFQRMGVGKPGDEMWRWTAVNTAYAVCPSYPSDIVVPAACTEKDVQVRWGSDGSLVSP